MKKKLLIFLAFCPFFNWSQTGDIPFQPGASSGAMGFAQVATTSVWGTHYNPGVIAWIENPSVAVGVDNRFLISELSGQGFTGVLPIKNSAVGLSFTHYGFDQYNRSRLGGNYGLKLSDHIAAGVGVYYDRLTLGGMYGSSSAVSISIGFSAKITEDLTLAASVFNPFRSGFANEPEENIASVINIGAQYAFSEKVRTAIEVEKDIKTRPGLKLGLEYLPTNKLFLRTGFKTLPQSYTFGIGLQLDKVKIDIASWIHPVLGASPMLSLQYDFKR